MTPPPDIDPEQVDDIATFRALVKQLQALIAMLQALIGDLRNRLSARESELAERDARIAALERRILGPKSERIPSPTDEARKTRTPEEIERARREAKRKRTKNRAQRDEALESDDEEHPVNCCPGCNGTDLVHLGEEVTHEIDIVPARAVIHRILRHKVLCGSCGQITTADAPPRVVDGGHYGPGVYAEAVVSKCADALPINRVSTRLERAGCRISRSTLNDLFHRAAELLAPLYFVLLQRVAAARYVNADETSHKVWEHEKCRGAFIWTFVAAHEGIEAFVFSPSRSGETPVEVLGGSVGDLQVDGYTGYNHVTEPEGRTRTGCLAHGRRRFFEARPSAPDEANEALDFIRKLYAIERLAADTGISGTPAHLELRQSRSRPICDRFHVWLVEQEGRHPPKGPMGSAIGYAIRQWQRLTAFLSDPRRRLDNNIAEGALRIWALGRHTFLWVGNDQAGANLAILRTLVATCRRNNVNPERYIADVLVRVQTHPASRIDELLPMNWVQLDASAAELATAGSLAA